MRIVLRRNDNLPLKHKYETHILNQIVDLKPSVWSVKIVLWHPHYATSKHWINLLLTICKSADESSSSSQSFHAVMVLLLVCLGLEKHHLSELYKDPL